MSPEQFNRRADAIAFIGFVFALGVLGGFVLTWEHQLKREALINQENVKW